MFKTCPDYRSGIILPMEASLQSEKYFAMNDTNISIWNHFFIWVLFYVVQTSLYKQDSLYSRILKNKGFVLFSMIFQNVIL